MTDQARADRLKAALRQNLKRRKAQARGRSGPGAPDAERPAGDDPPERDPSGDSRV